MTIEMRVPTLGESVTQATVATWLKKAGQEVGVDEMVCELETDKVSVEVPAPVSGVIDQIVAVEGQTVEVGAVLAVLRETDRSDRSAPAEAPASVSRAQQGEQPPATEAGSDDAHPPMPAPGTGIRNAPSARKMMAEGGLDPAQVPGSGRDGRVMKEDVIAARATASPPAQPPVPSATIGGSSGGAAASVSVPAEDAAREERVRMSKLRQTIARRLKESQNTAAQLTTYNEVDMTACMDLRSAYRDLFEQKHGVRLGLMSFFTKACCQALHEVPEVNAQIDGAEIVYKNFVHMGIAAGTPQGLVVPVIRNVHAMGFAEIEKKIAEKGRRARDGKLSMDEMQGGTFTISNGGVYGSLMSAPILNPPQSGILGMHKIQDRPVAVNGAVVIRPMMYLALSYDHRIVDGKGAVTFLVRVKEALEDPRRLLIDL